MTNGETHETETRQQVEILETVPRRRLENKGNQRRSATDPRRWTPLMPCNYPGTGRKSPSGKVTYYGHIQAGAGKIPPLPPNYTDFPLPCGKCTGCKLERSRQTAVRLMHEAQQHKNNSFLNLTYKTENLPFPRGVRCLVEDDQAGTACPEEDSQVDKSRARGTRTHEEEEQASLSKKDLQAFTKRLNEDVRRRTSSGVKYYACGEYGEKKGRPHYHIAVFGEDFSDDRTYAKAAPSGAPLWRSSRLDRLWPHGEALIGELTFESAAYVARYIMKKITGVIAPEHYRRIDREGKEIQLQPEFNVMSRRPGIARQWFLENMKDVYPHDAVIARGHPSKPPRYYDELLKKLDEASYHLMKFEREIAPRNAESNHPARLEAREQIAQAKLTQTKRTLE